MTAAFAPARQTGGFVPDAAALPGAQNLLVLKPARQFYFAEIAAVGIYALIIAAGLNYKPKPVEAPPEEPLELVLVPAEPPPEEPPPPEEVKPPEPEPPPPPPEAVTPPVAPVEPPKVEPPKPKPKPKPLVKPVPKVEHKPQPAARVAPRREDAAPARPVPAGASASAIANQLHGCLARAGANFYPESQKPRSGHVGYRAMISASGSVSYSWSSSGNPAFDAAAQRAGARCGHVEAPGRPAALSGAINFRYN